MTLRTTQCSKHNSDRALAWCRNKRDSFYDSSEEECCDFSDEECSDFSDEERYDYSEKESGHVNSDSRENAPPPPPRAKKQKRDRFMTGRPGCITFKHTDEVCDDDGGGGESCFLKQAVGAYNVGDSQVALDKSLHAPQGGYSQYHQSMYNAKKAPRSIMWCNQDFSFDEANCKVLPG